MKIAITGVLGYTGMVLANTLLSYNYEVVGIDNCMYGQDYLIPTLLRHDNFTFYKEDIRNSDTMSKLTKDCSVIYWLAALVGAPVCDKLASKVYDVNYWAVKEFVKYMPKDQRIVYPNTNSGYGIGSTEMCTEESPLKPISSYGKSKCQAEEAILSHENSISLRLATVFGMSPRPRFDLLVNSWAAKLLIKGNLSIYEPQFRRNFLHIQDLTRAYLWFMEDKHKGVYNIGSPTENLTKMELGQKLATILSISQENITKGQGEDPDKRDYLVDNTKLLRTGFRFNYKLEDGVADIKKYVQIVGKAALEMGNV